MLLSDQFLINQLRDHNVLHLIGKINQDQFQETQWPLEESKDQFQETRWALEELEDQFQEIRWALEESEDQYNQEYQQNQEDLSDQYNQEEVVHLTARVHLVRNFIQQEILTNRTIIDSL